MVHLNLHFACLSIASILYQAHAVPVPAQPRRPGDIVFMNPVQQFGAGGQVEHPHIVMAPTQHYPGTHVVAPVTHSTHPALGHSIPVPQNLHPPTHPLTGNVLQLETAHTASMNSRGGRYRNAHVDDHARATIAADKHTEASNAHHAAANAHDRAAASNTAVGNHPQAAQHTNAAHGHRQQAANHANEARNHQLAAAGHNVPINMHIEGITPSKQAAEASEHRANQSHAHANGILHNEAAHAHTGAANLHGQAATAHISASQRFNAAGDRHTAQRHSQQAAIHQQQQNHHHGQAAMHNNPANHAGGNPIQSKADAHHAQQTAAQSRDAAHRSGPPPPAHYPPQHYGGGGHYGGHPQGRHY